MAGKFQIVPIETQAFVDEQGFLTSAARNWLELVPPALTSPANSGTVPAAANSQGIAGQMATDGNFLYICIGVNSWKKVALSAI